jgi:aspartate/methionine/tyrosine aminotransferase
LFYTASNIASVVQFGGIGGLEGPQDCIDAFRSELAARRNLFYEGIRSAAGHVFSGNPPHGAFYAFLKIDPDWQPPSDITQASRSWAMAEFLISKGRIGCVPGVDFGAQGEGYLRFCFARDRRELTGALESMRTLFQTVGADAVGRVGGFADGRRLRSRWGASLSVGGFAVGRRYGAHGVFRWRRTAVQPAYT